MHFHVLRPEGFFFDLIFVGELTLDELRIHPHFYLAASKPTLFCLSERKYHCFVFCEIIRALANILFQFYFLGAILNNNTDPRRTGIVPCTSVCVDYNFWHAHADASEIFVPTSILYA